MLHQGNPDVTSALIDSLYPALKVSVVGAMGQTLLHCYLASTILTQRNSPCVLCACSTQEMELKDSSLLQTYEKYLEAYALALEEGARPECMHPADIPSLRFLVDITVHLCSIPVRTTQINLTPASQ